MLLLRGPQTPGELRGRTERMHRFDEIGDVLRAAKADGAGARSAAVLPRQPGTKESRYAHLLSGAVETAEFGLTAECERDPRAGERSRTLEAAVAEKRDVTRVASLQKRIDGPLVIEREAGRQRPPTAARGALRKDQNAN